MRPQVPTAAIALACLLVGCASRGNAEGEVEASSIAGSPAPTAALAGRCTRDVEPTAMLTSRERCELLAIAARCSSADRCMIDCLVNERHRASVPGGLIVEIEGGCEEICFPGADQIWLSPEGYSKCSHPLVKQADWP
jgi:hypothetical protein